MKKYEKPLVSLIVPVYNRVDEVRELLQSLVADRQDNAPFEVVIVEDGSTQPCRDVVESFAHSIDVKYIFKENEGRSIARNVGIDNARSDYFVFFDSDCVAPEHYFARLAEVLNEKQIDCYGGPDDAHSSFTPIQKAINYAMTSFLTTGGIRGGKRSLEKFVPRTFNMGFSRKVYEKVGGFREMFSEDIDMSTRIRNAGFRVELLADQKVYHKRRLGWKKFWRQVHIFGQSRITLMQLYPGSLKPVHALPALFVAAMAVAAILAAIWTPLSLLPFAIYFLAIFFDALRSTQSLKIAAMAVPASFIQLFGYGTGFIRAFVKSIVMGGGRDLDREIALRKGK